VFYSPSIRSYLCMSLGVVLASSIAFAQADASGKRTHAELFEPVEKLPLKVAPLVDKEGKPLDDEKRAEFDKVRKQIEAAKKDIDAGNLDDARTKLDPARTALIGLVNDNNYLITTANLWKNFLDAAQSKPDVARQLAMDTAQCVKLVDDGKYADAIELADQVLKKIATLTTAYLPLAVTVTFEKGDAQLNLADYETSTATIERAVALAARVYGTNHPEYAKTRDKLGWSMMHEANRGAADRKKLEDAADAVNSAVSILQATTGDSPAAAESIDNLGTILFQMRKVPQAVNAKLRALAIRKKTLPPDDLNLGVSYSNLGWLYGRIPETLDEAIPMRQAALDIFAKNLSPDHPWLLLEESNLAYDYYRTRQLDKAIALYEKILARKPSDSNSNRFDIVQRSALLGSAYVANGEIDKGIAQMDKTLADAQRAFEAGFKQQAIVSVRDLANSARQASLLQPAAKYMKVLVDWMRAENKDTKNADPAIQAAQYGSVLVDAGKFEEAIRVLQDAINEIKRIKGAGDEQLINAHASMARALLAQGKADEALPHCDMALQITEVKSGPESILTAYALMLLARGHTAAGSTTLAEFNFKSSLATFDQEPPPDPPGLIRTRIEYAKCLLRMDKGAQAFEQLDTALKLCRSLEEKNPDNINLKSITASVLAALVDGAEQFSADQKKNVAAWKKEAVDNFKQMKDRRALNAEDAQWLEAHQ